MRALAGDRLFQQIDAADADFAGTRRQIAGQHLHGGGFAGAVGAEQAEHFAAPHFQVDPVDGGVRTEAA